MQVRSIHLLKVLIPRMTERLTSTKRPRILLQTGLAVQKIQSKLPQRNPAMSEEEAAFLEAAEEQLAARGAGRRNLSMRRGYL